jgi:hypothetical protein
MYDHISLEDDALCINLGKTKGDQEGKKSFLLGMSMRIQYPQKFAQLLDSQFLCFVKNINEKVAVDCYLDRIRKIALVSGFPTCSKNKDNIVTMVTSG